MFAGRAEVSDGVGRSAGMIVLVLRGDVHVGAASFAWRAGGTISVPGWKNRCQVGWLYGESEAQGVVWMAIMGEGFRVVELEGVDGWTCGVSGILNMSVRLLSVWTAFLQLCGNKESVWSSVQAKLKSSSTSVGCWCFGPFEMRVFSD
jgi:hypothetical protein